LSRGEHAQRAARSAELFYQMLLGEMLAAQGAYADAQALLMEAARSNGGEPLYRRAVELALESRSGPQALANAQSWLAAWPQSRDANRFVLHILLNLGRIADSAGHLARELQLVPAQEKGDLLAALPGMYGNAADKALAADVAAQALAHTLDEAEHAALAWAALGHIRLRAGQTAQALHALRQAQAAAHTGAAPEPQTRFIAALALQLLHSGVDEVEADIQQQLARRPSLALGLDYASALAARQRLRDARRQLIVLTAAFPRAPAVWAALTSLQLQSGEVAQAQASAERMGELLDAPPEEESQAGERAAQQAQYTVLRAQIAEKQGRWREADALLRSIAGAENALFVQTQRAALLMRQGQVQQALALLRAAPASGAGQQRLKLLAEVDLLRDAGLLRQAHALQTRLHRENPDDAGTAYDLALLAERIGNLDEMEQLLRGIIARHPDYAHAYNALGYSFAERNIRLPEAEQLIRRALDLLPGDPFITDSLAWVKYRLGDLHGARQLLEAAWSRRADVEISAHLGEVLWQLNERERARTIWQHGAALDPDNNTLRQTLRRLGVAL